MAVRVMMACAPKAAIEIARQENVYIIALLHVFVVMTTILKYSLQGTTQGSYLTGWVPPVRFSM